ncbi:oligosaccharide repeat unit polymerase Wzy [Streptococcus pneumoniae]|nr:oligosaccharide repeat unit polymerase Wzy [Streptococcus pneumoniae]VJK84830.1 oligosaccharide repeat unit polymerase Wzy [Streptococcus pneumoniae]VKD16923.1 oligosaccharide repeat unit polymerase Wzy [Streptococcus pneumoniae]VKZ14059.1 oligosaccharide repeat unit polymerase Wzy [Streptococcus pneumoniae]VPQ17658.1 oligosaccharide repeat unit polymerase Wzy [Streptococcus pneumoniae]
MPEILALSALTIFLVMSIFDVTFYVQYLPKIVHRILIAILLILLVIKESYKRKLDYRTIISLFSTVLIYLLIGKMSTFSSNIAIGFIFIYVLRDIPFKSVAKISLAVSVFMLLFVIASAKLGVIINYLEISGPRVRSYLGFRYALYPSILLMNVIAITLYLKQNNIRYWQWLLLTLSVYWVYGQTDSRLTFYNSCILLVFNILIKWFPDILSKLGNVFKIFRLTFIINAIISFWISINYLGSNNSFVNSFLFKLNHMLGDRLFLANKSLELFGFGLFGKQVDWNGNGLTIEGVRNYQTYLYVDNLYIQILQKFGLLVLVLMLALLTLTLFKAIKKDQWVIAFILIVMSFQSMIDDLNMYLHYNIFWILIGSLIYTQYHYSNEGT